MSFELVAGRNNGYGDLVGPDSTASGACARLRARFVMNNPVLAFSFLVLAALQTAGQGPVESLMKAKAGYAHRLLDAVVMGELETAREQAFRLKAVAETADWNVMDTPEYVRESEAFLRATERLLQAAGSKNHEATALAYVELTLSCVHCHRYVNANR
jgi:hypothetical protein